MYANLALPRNLHWNSKSPFTHTTFLNVRDLKDEKNPSNFTECAKSLKNAGCDGSHFPLALEGGPLQRTSHLRKVYMDVQFKSTIGGNT